MKNKTVLSSLILHNSRKYKIYLDQSQGYVMLSPSNLQFMELLLQMVESIFFEFICKQKKIIADNLQSERRY